MKTLKLSLFGVIVALLFASCQSPSEKFIKHFTSFVEDVEQNHETYTNNDSWESIDSQLQSYRDQYKEMEEQFTPEQKKQVGELVGRYYKARFSDWGIMKIARWLINKWDYVKGIIEGFGIKIDVCGFIADLIGVDVCSYLNFGDGQRGPIELNESAIEE